MVSLTEIRERLRLDNEYPSDGTLSSILEEAIRMVENKFDISLNRTTEIVTLDCFPLSWQPIHLIFRGLDAVITGVSYTDKETSQVVQISGHRSIVSRNLRKDIYVFPPDNGWPSPFSVKPGSVVLNGSHGATSTNLPKDIKGALIIIVAKIWEGAYDPEPDPAVLSRLTPYERIT